MFVVTIDQIGSRVVGDRVDGLLVMLDTLAEGSTQVRRSIVRAFDRTVGDEVQGALDDPVAVVDLALTVLRTGRWSIGIGAGEVATPLPASVRAAQGPAFVAAREAVEAAKSRARAVPLAVRGRDDEAAADAEAVLALVGAVRDRRSDAGWQAVDALAARPWATQEEVAAALGVSQQAVSQRLRTALWGEELAARAAAARLLARAEGRVGGDR
ncbi:SatD family protein [Actinotalea sp. JY-7876]|uniref:SatD family protein n=2 Tax=unclassified Actinotalea TaxID=2638618 RepID=UPI0015F69AD8|nr:SatD family protein [Actinotalea sp. JY-7876]